jgi:hypothetical protein
VPISNLMQKLFSMRTLVGVAAIVLAIGACGCLANEAPSLMYRGYQYQVKMNKESLDADAFEPAPDAKERERKANLPPQSSPVNGN